MKHRSKLSTLAALAAALDVKFSLFDALEDADTSAKHENNRKLIEYSRRPVRLAMPAYAQVRS